MGTHTWRNWWSFVDENLNLMRDLAQIHKFVFIAFYSTSVFKAWALKRKKRKIFGPTQSEKGGRLL